MPEVLKQGLQKQELTEPKSGDEISFGIALANDKIINAPIERLKQVLRLVMVKIGLRAVNWPADEEKAILIEYIVEHYGGHTPEEILLAFDMAIAGKLEVEVNCYENFSCLYFSNIMNAYRLWAKDQHKQIKPIMIEEPKLSDITNLEWYNQTKIQVKNGLSVEFVPLPLYEFAIKSGLVSVDNKTKWEYVRKAIEYRQAVLYENVQKDSSRENNTVFSEFMRMKHIGEFEGDERERLLNLSRKMILFDQFKK